jgi:hypothetical protein
VVSDGGIFPVAIGCTPAGPTDGVDAPDAREAAFFGQTLPKLMTGDRRRGEGDYHIID